MRKILFRGKRTDNGNWAYGDLSQHKTGKVFIKSGSAIHSCEVIPETVGQYTGVTDKNVRKIFEGDILSIKFLPRYVERVSWDGKPDAIAKVFWDFSAFRLRAKNDVDIRFADFCDICFKETEIIGNIYDNTELVDK